MHIHLSKNALTRAQIYKMLEFFKINSEFILRVSGRTSSRFNSWCGIDRYSKRELAHACIRKGNTGSGHSAALNITQETVEMRIFRGNLSAKGFLANVDFALAISEFCAQASINRLTEAGFRAWVTQPPQLRRFAAFNSRFYGITTNKKGKK